MESLEEFSDYTDLLNSIQEAATVLSMRNAVINTPQGQSITVTSGSTSTSTTGIMSGTTYITPQYFMQERVYGTIENIEPPVVPENTIDELTLMISSLEKQEEEEVQKAVKHLTFAKAYLEKAVLNKLNQKL